MVDYVLLKTEVEKPAYVGLSDVQIAAAINAATYAVAQNIQSTNAVNALLFTSAGDWGNVVAVADGIINETQANRLRCVSVKELFTRNDIFEAVDDTRWTRFIVVVDALVSATRMSAEGKTALVEMRTRNDPLWRKFGDRELDFNDIVLAREA